MKHFAPVSRGVGLHWHHFDHPILPPIVDVEADDDRYIDRSKVVVYLPFEDPKQIIELPAQMPGI